MLLVSFPYLCNTTLSSKSSAMNRPLTGKTAEPSNRFMLTYANRPVNELHPTVSQLELRVGSNP